MEDQLVERVQSVLRELAALRAELANPATDPATGLAVPKLPAERMRAFKHEIDQMRMFLWAYLDTWAASSANPKNRWEQIRMDSVAEMLQQLRQEFHGTGIPPTTEGRRLSDQIRAVTPLLPD